MQYYRNQVATEVRVVYDGSLAEDPGGILEKEPPSTGLFLNDALMVSSILQNYLCHQLVHFRKTQYEASV